MAQGGKVQQQTKAELYKLDTRQSPEPAQQNIQSAGISERQALRSRQVQQGCRAGQVFQGTVRSLQLSVCWGSEASVPEQPIHMLCPLTKTPAEVPWKTGLQERRIQEGVEAESCKLDTWQKPKNRHWSFGRTEFSGNRAPRSMKEDEGRMAGRGKKVHW